MGVFARQIFLPLIVGVLVLVGFNSDSCRGHQSPAPGHTCDHGHHHHDDDHSKISVGGAQSKKLPEELAEEEDLKIYAFESTHKHNHDQHHHHYDHDHSTSDLKLSGAGLWVRALGCSLLVSMASLICLIILPVMFVKGKPSKAVVDSLALFGAGAMLGDAFLHQLPHAFGGEHSHGHEHNHSHGHDHDHSGHAHSLKDLSVGLSVLAGIVLFLIVEKVVRYVEEKSEGTNSWSHHHHKSSKKVKSDGDAVEKLDRALNSNDEQQNQADSALKKRKKKVGQKDDKSKAMDSSNGPVGDGVPVRQPSNLVFGYLNLFSDGVHNFTDGIALGSAFLLYGSVGGWSRTLFLLAHELPQEVGDFGILVRSGFSVPKALFFNFLSALVALGGTALALLIGQDPGQSSIIEGFTAGGFIYIAVAGVLAEMNNNGGSGWKSTIMQLVSLVSGMAIALCISLVE